MATFVLLVLALAWGGVLVWWIKSRSEGSLLDSVGVFSRDLNMLRRTTPGRLRTAYATSGISSIVPRGQAAGLGNLGNHAYSSTASSGRATTVRTGGYASQQLNSSSERVAMARRRRTQRRRRDALFLLVALVVATFLIAVVTDKGSLIGLQIICDLALAGYVGLLVKANQERQYRKAIQRTGYNYQISPRTRSTAYAGGAAQADPSYGGRPMTADYGGGNYYDQAFGGSSSTQQTAGYGADPYAADQYAADPYAQQGYDQSAGGYYDEQGYWVEDPAAYSYDDRY